MDGWIILEANSYCFGARDPWKEALWIGGSLITSIVFLVFSFVWFLRVQYHRVSYIASRAAIGPSTRPSLPQHDHNSVAGRTLSSGIFVSQRNIHSSTRPYISPLYCSAVLRVVPVTRGSMKTPVGVER